MFYVIIMAGGAGTRFWPASRAAFPKQLLPLASNRTMIQATVDRAYGLASLDRILVVTNAALLERMSEQLPDLPLSSILGEPCKRDTAPCVGLAARIVRQRDENGTMLVMPADHVIDTISQFHDAVRKGTQLIEEDPRRIVTFGVRPTYPAESFGYIERGEELGPGIFRVQMFREKPNAETAQRYLAEQRFYWNSGIFLWRAQAIDDALARYEPDMHRHLVAIADAYGQEHFRETFTREFAGIRGKSIDYAVMERYEHVVVIEAPFAWDDVGSWQAIARLRGVDPDGNTIMGKHVGLNTRGCIVHGEGDHLIVTLGMDDCLIVHTPDATLVARKQDEESVRKVVEQLREQGKTNFL